MHRKYNFMSMEIYNLKGKKNGVVCDISLDFREMSICGFHVESSIPFKNKAFISKNDVVYYSDDLIAKKFTKVFGIAYSSIENMDIYNLEGEILGIVNDIIVDEDLKLIAVIISSGFLKDIFDGRRILLVKDLIVGDENIVYHGREKIQFKNLAHI